MKIWFLLFAGLVFSRPCYGQKIAEGFVTGTVIAAGDKKPVEGVSVLLSRDSVVLGNGVVSGSDGKFSVPIRDTGIYVLSFSHVGFKEQALVLQVGAAFSGWHVGVVSLQSGTGLLPEIVIKTDRPLVEQKADRLVYNAEKDLSTLGGTAADVLRNVPMLSVDGDGSVQLRGSSSIRVLINNRPTTLIAASVADALRQLPADMIKSVEVITSPTARYDAEGAAGIINIITKKNLLEGLTGTLNIIPGNVSTIGSGSANFRRPGYGINMAFSINQFYNRGKTYLERETFSNGLVYTQEGTTRNRSGFVNPRVGFDVTLNQRSSISGGFTFSPAHSNVRNSQDATSRAPGIADDKRNLLFISKSRQVSYGANFDYLLTFKEPQKEFSILTDYSVNRVTNLASQDEFAGSAGHVYFQRNNNKNINREATAQADYTHPFRNKTTLETGIKTILRKATSDVDYFDGFPATGEEFSAVNMFSYDQDVLAAYLVYGFKAWQNLNVKLGSRYEKTEIRAHLKTQGTRFNTGYHNWIPSINASFPLNEKHTLTGGYTQRLQRPQLFFLNPYLEVITPKVIRQGNPELDPELAHLVELGYGTYGKKGSLNLSVFARLTSNAISSVLRMEGDTTFIGFENIAANKTYGISVSGNLKLVKGWSLNSNSNFSYARLNSNGLSNSGWMYNIFASSSLNLGKGWAHTFIGSFNSRRVILQGRMAAFFYHNTTLRKDFKNKRGSLGLNIANPFMRGTRMRTSIVSSQFAQTEDNINYTRGVRVSFQYRFGKLQQSKGPRKAKKSISNDDAMRG